jgi:hypothetical protein
LVIYTELCVPDADDVHARLIALDQSTQSHHADQREPSAERAAVNLSQRDDAPDSLD